MKEAEALRLVRELKSVLQGVERLEEQLVAVALLTERRAYLESEVHGLSVRHRDLETAVTLAEATLEQRRQEIGSEIGDLEAKAAKERNRLGGDMATALREHGARLKAMEHNEAKAKAELGAKEGEHE